MIWVVGIVRSRDGLDRGYGEVCLGRKYGEVASWF